MMTVDSLLNVCPAGDTDRLSANRYYRVYPKLSMGGNLMAPGDRTSPSVELVELGGVNCEWGEFWELEGGVDERW